MRAPNPAAVTLEAAGGAWEFFCLSMSSPHAVTFGPAPSDGLFHAAGPVPETHPAFPQRVNIDWNEVLDEHHLRMRVWERGSGVTMACGTGATASAAPAIAGAVQKPRHGASAGRRSAH